MIHRTPEIDKHLTLFKRILTDTVYDESLRNKFFKGQLSDTEIDTIISSVVDISSEIGNIWPAKADTMIGMKRLGNIEECVEKVLRDNVPGDFIETGVWRGGATILMRALLHVYSIGDRTVYVADSFEGLPKPDIEKYPQDLGDIHSTIEFLKVSLDQVKENFKKYGLLDNQVKFIKGFFSESLNNVPFDKLAILRLDGDMYSSTWEVLTKLYDKLSIGGFLIIDDYALSGCHLAINDFRIQNNITEPIIQIDWTGHYWRKEK